MFSAYCPDHAQPVLLGLRNILRIDGDEDGLLVSWLCWCGYTGRERFGPLPCTTHARIRQEPAGSGTEGSG